MSTPTLSTSPAAAPELHHVVCPGASQTHPESHRMAWWSWGDVSNPHTVVCVHGLSRQGRDFDALARDLAEHCHVVSVDIVGRGRSDWLANPAQYQIPTYAADMLCLLKDLKARKGLAPDADFPIDWVGTSMGGLIGLVLSAFLATQPVARLRRVVLNDVGPRLRPEAVARIGEYLGQPHRFASLQEGADYLGTISTGFGPHTPEQWLALSTPMLRPTPDGAGFGLHYDPAIAAPFRAMNAESASAGEAMLWQCFDALHAETLLLRGRDSDLLDPDTAALMGERGPRARLVEFNGVGHAPMLVVDDQRRAVKDFLLA